MTEHEASEHEAAEQPVVAVVVRQRDDRLVIDLPEAAVEAMALTEGSVVGVQFGPRPPLDPKLRAAMARAWEQWEPGLRYLAERSRQARQDDPDGAGGGSE